MSKCAKTFETGSVNIACVHEHLSLMLGFIKWVMSGGGRWTKKPRNADVNVEAWGQVGSNGGPRHISTLHPGVGGLGSWQTASNAVSLRQVSLIRDSCRPRCFLSSKLQKGEYFHQWEPFGIRANFFNVILTHFFSSSFPVSFFFLFPPLLLPFSWEFNNSKSSQGIGEETRTEF